jgi:hypothetical protein
MSEPNFALQGSLRHWILTARACLLADTLFLWLWCPLFLSRDGVTGPSGWVRFIEGVGIPPCNPLELRLPIYGVSKDVGCHNGYKELVETITVGVSGVLTV